MRNRVVITTHRPWLRWAVVCGVTVVVSLGAWALYVYTRSVTVSDFEQTRAERKVLIKEREKLQDQLREQRLINQKLIEQTVYLERSLEIERTSGEEVKSAIKALQRESSDLQEQVAFYRGIVSPNESLAGVRVYEFGLRQAGVPRVFRYELVLIQSVRHDRRVRGEARISIQGMRNGALEVLELGAIALNSEQNLVFSFKYFQEFSGEFKLPVDFRPVRVTVTVDPRGTRQQNIEDEFDWKKLVGEPS